MRFVSLRLPKDTQLVNFVMHIFDNFCDFYISLFIVCHLKLKLAYFSEDYGRALSQNRKCPPEVTYLN